MQIETFDFTNRFRNTIDTRFLRGFVVLVYMYRFDRHANDLSLQVTHMLKIGNKNVFRKSNKEITLNLDVAI